MPICPRCGKHLSTEQALMYHLNKKYKCSTWKCYKCNSYLNTKFQLQLHEMQCVNETQFDYEFLMKLYNNVPIPVLECDNNDTIVKMNPKALETFNNAMNKEFNDILKNKSYKKVDNIIFVNAC